MGWRVYIELDGDKEYLGSFPTQEEAEIVCEHAVEDEVDAYGFVLDPDGEVVYRLNEPKEEWLYDDE